MQPRVSSKLDVLVKAQTREGSHLASLLKPSRVDLSLPRCSNQGIQYEECGVFYETLFVIKLDECCKKASLCFPPWRSTCRVVVPPIEVLTTPEVDSTRHVPTGRTRLQITPAFSGHSPLVGLEHNSQLHLIPSNITSRKNISIL